MATLIKINDLGNTEISIEPHQLIFKTGDDEVVGVELKNEVILHAGSEITSRFGESSDKIYTAAFELIQQDPHQWSSRPCATCKAVSSLIKDSFGCEKKRVVK